MVERPVCCMYIAAIVWIFIKKSENINWIYQDVNKQPINIFNNSNFPEESIYADDYDNITTNFEVKRNFNKVVKNILLEDNLKINENKTEHTTFTKEKIKVMNIHVNKWMIWNYVY